MKYINDNVFFLLVYKFSNLPKRVSGNPLTLQGFSSKQVNLLSRFVSKTHTLHTTTSSQSQASILSNFSRNTLLPKNGNDHEKI